MTDELTTDLAQFADLRVISRTSAMHYKDGNKTAPQIGKELGVDASGGRFGATCGRPRADSRATD